MKLVPRRLVPALVVLSSLSAPSFGADGVEVGVVRFVQIAALDGPAAALGTGMRQGIIAAFEEANREGGIHGRQVVLESFDDGYEPDRSVAELRRVIDEGNHFALIGPVGTPTSQATQPVATEAGMPFIAPFTGAGFLRDSTLENVINVRASYAAETEAWARHLVDELGLTDIAILYQDDSFGRAGLSGIQAALDKRGLSLVAEGSYTRNTVAVKSALLEIRRAEPQAVVMVGAYRPVAEFIKLARSLSFDPVFVNISFVGSEALAAELGADGEGVIVSQVVPFPWDSSIPIVAQYHAALEAAAGGVAPGFISLEGYLAGRVALSALEAAGPDPTRETYRAALRSLGSFDMGGLRFSYGPADNQGLDDVFLTRIDGSGGFESITAQQPVEGG